MNLVNAPASGDDAGEPIGSHAVWVFAVDWSGARAGSILTVRGPETRVTTALKALVRAAVALNRKDSKKRK